MTDHSVDPHPSTPLLKRIPTVGWLVLSFVAVLMLAFTVSSILTDSDLEAVADPAPSDSYNLLGGGTASLVDHRGQPVVLNFFGSWCPPCIREMPDLEAANQTYADDVHFVGLAVADREEDLRALIETTGVTYEIGLDPSEAVFRQIPQALAMPTTVFINADGSIGRVHAGILTADQIDDFVGELITGEQP